MYNKWNMLLVLIVLTAILSVSNSVAVAQGPLINITIDSSGITWQAQGNNDAVHLTVNGPDGFHLDEQYAGNTARFNANSGPDGTYNYELVTIPHIDEQVRAAMASVTEENRAAVKQQLREAGKLVDPVVQSGAFYVLGGAIVDSDGDQIDPNKDIQHLDDVIITFSLCVGNDCVNGESFGFDTLRLKENNLRIHFDDTSNSGSFPSNDWRIIANDSANGGDNYLAIEDSTAGRQVFRVDAGAPANSLRVNSAGDIGIGTSNPIVETHIVDGDSPTVRLEQNGSSGFTAQTWDLAGNEANFFIRDVTNGSKLPFKIKPGAPTSSIFIKASGEIGFGTESPDAEVDIESNTSPGFRLSNTGSAGGSWDLFMNSNTGRFNLRDNSTSNIPFKLDQGANGDLLQVGVNASGQVDINGDLVVTGQCSEADGGCAPDYVFAPEYEMLTLAELEAYIIANKHLPNVPSGAELDKNGINVQAFNYTLLEKIEELTLYTLQQEQTIKELEARLEALEGTE